MLYAFAWLDNSAGIPVNPIPVALLFSKYLVDLFLLILDNIIIHKPLEAAYIDVFATLFYAVEIGAFGWMVFKQRGKWWAIGGIVLGVAIELVFIDQQAWQTASVLLITWAMSKVIRGVGRVGGLPKATGLLFLQYYANLLGFTMFEDNYLYFRPTAEARIFILSLVVIQVLGI